MDLSVVAPLYNEEENAALLAAALDKVLRPLGRSYEIILVDDGSTDRTWDVLCQQAQKFPHLELIRLRRNFGQTAAMTAGFDAAQGEVIITLDADLQNDPEDIPQLLRLMDEGYDVVSGWRKDRKDKFWSRRLPSMLANGLISWTTGVNLHDYGCTLKAYRKDVIKNIQLYGQMHRFIPALASWVGGRIKEVPVRHHPRRLGQSKYGIMRTFRVILDLITVKFLLHYTTGPMQMFGKLAACFLLPGLLSLLFIVGANIFYHLFGTAFGSELIKRPFWVVTSFMLIFMGIQFIGMGLLAEIQTRTYHESQNKRTYVVLDKRQSL